MQLGRLGADLLARAGRDWRSEQGTRLIGGQCHTFAVTGREVCGAFLSYWRNSGLDLGDPGISDRESLALFGLPLTPTAYEVNSSGDRVITQWFERARFEYHPSNPEPYTVLLGRLGAELNGEQPPMPQVRLTLDPGPSVKQGGTIAISAEVSGSTAGVRAWLGDAPLVVTQQGGRWAALGGVHGMAAVGPLTLRIELPLRDGRTAAAATQIRVQDGGYPTEYIDLPPEVEDRLNENQEALAEENRRVREIWQQISVDRRWSGSFVMPTQGAFVSDYGGRRSYNGGPVSSFHEGVDIANAVGTPILAAGGGIVVLAEPDMVARGGAVIIDHGWGVHSGYWHMEQVSVRVGDQVSAGQLIGGMGARGMVTGPHLHWELRIGATSVDPMEWIGRQWPAR